MDGWIGESRNRVNNSLQNHQYVNYCKWVEYDFVSMDGDKNARWVVHADVVSNLHIMDMQTRMWCG